MRRIALLPLVAALASAVALAAPPTAAGAPAAAAIQAPTAANPCPRGCMNFVVNVHDVGHVDESADTLLHLADIFAKHGVKGEFYMTGPMVELYLAQRPDVVEKLKSTGMTISYHVRPPHPLHSDFDGPLQGLDDAKLRQTLLDYETYRLDRATGQLDRSKPGGYALVRDTFGSAPLTVVAPNDDPRIRRAALRVYKDLGAKAVVWYHEEGGSIDDPLQEREGLLVRPSDFSVTRWEAAGFDNPQFWWNHVAESSAYDPVRYLKKRLAEWKAPRGALVTALVHENNFYRAGAESWTLSYYSDKKKSEPLPPPWSLTPPEKSKPRAAAEEAAIWDAYDTMVGWAAKNMTVVTAAELVELPR